MRITVKIDSEDNNLVERRFFEHAAGRDNVAYLMKDSEVNEKILDRYITVVEKRFYELEKVKSLLSKKYAPEVFNGKAYEYTFDFDDETITYVAKAD